MPLQKLQFRPGVNREGTTLANEGGWFECDKVRFRSGYPEKIGGWSALSYTAFLGTCRSLWNWITLRSYNLLGVGTNLKFYVETTGGDYYDITPIKANTTGTTTFVATNGSNVITVTDTAVSGLQANDFVTFSAAASLGGAITALVLNQEYQIKSVLSNTKYTIETAVNANASDTGNGGSGVKAAYQINTGLDIYTVGTGWGAGAWSPSFSVTLGSNPIATTNASNVITITQASHGYSTAAGSFVVGQVYKITSIGSTPTDFTLVGAANNNLGTIFTATDDGAANGNGTASIAYVNINGAVGTTVTAGSFVIGKRYQIISTGSGSTNFTLIGAANNNVGTAFTATGVGTGTGTASLLEIGGINTALINRTVEITVTTTNAFTFRTNGPIVTSGNFSIGLTYQIVSVGTTNFTLIGASANTVGVVFVATGAGVGTGTADLYPIPTATATVASGGGTAVTARAQTGDRGWGQGFATGAGIGIQLRLWSQINFGEVLLFSPRGGALYSWDPGAGTTPAYNERGEVVSGTDVPAYINQIMVSDSSRIAIAFGCSDYGTYPQPQDPMLIRWSDAENYTSWSVDPVLSFAGFNRLSTGSSIISAIQTRQEILVWTDAALYSMQFIGPPSVFGFSILADNISIISPNAAVTANGVTYWMGTDKFYVYSGRTETLPCSLRQYIFEDINRNQYFQCFAGTNEGYSEIWWFYCSADSDVIDRYVIFNYLDRVWYYGTMPRSAWLDSPLRPFPQAATLNNLIVYHESSVDDGSVNPPVPIEAYIQSSDFDIGDGHNYGFVWQMVPDITFDGSTTAAPEFPSVNFTVRPRQNPGAPYGVSNNPAVTAAKSYAVQHTYNVQEFTQLVNTRIRGRQMAFKISSNTLGTQWQLGTPRINVRPDGRR